jgi:hypothetical protein
MINNNYVFITTASQQREHTNSKKFGLFILLFDKNSELPKFGIGKMEIDE